MRTLLKDLLYGVRMLVKTPGFTIVAVLSLALGTGVNNTVFSLLDAVMLRSLPIQRPEEIVDIATRLARGVPHTDFSESLNTFKHFCRWLQKKVAKSVHCEEPTFISKVKERATRLSGL